MIFGGRPCWKAIWQEAAFLTVDLLWWQAQLLLRSGNSSFLVAGPVGRRQGYNPNLGTRTELEGDWATTAILELGFLGGRPSWKMPASQCIFYRNECGGFHVRRAAVCGWLFTLGALLFR